MMSPRTHVTAAGPQGGRSHPHTRQPGDKRRSIGPRSTGTILTVYRPGRMADSHATSRQRGDCDKVIGRRCRQMVGEPCLLAG